MKRFGAWDLGEPRSCEQLGIFANNGFGINWSFQKVNLIGGSSTGFSSSNTAFLQFATGNLQTELSFILTSGQGHLVASPIATTLNNVPVFFNLD